MEKMDESGKNCIISLLHIALRHRRGLRFETRKAAAAVECHPVYTAKGSQAQHGDLTERGVELT